MGPQGRSGQVRKISPPPGDSIPGPSSPWPVSIPTALPGPLVLFVLRVNSLIERRKCRTVLSMFVSRRKKSKVYRLTVLSNVLTSFCNK